MKTGRKKRRWIAILLAVTLISGTGYFGYRMISGGAGPHEGHRQFYTCPMHPQIVRDQPGQCPICGMNLVPVHEEKKKEEPEPRGEGRIMYKSTMMPGEIRDKPGKDSMGMEMIPFTPEEEQGADGQDMNIPGGLAPVTIGEGKRRTMGLSFTEIKTRPLAREIRSSMLIVPDETRQYVVTTKINGWVEKLYVNQTGQFVRRGGPLLAIYSQELFAAQQEYLSVIRARASLSGGGSIKGTLDSIEQAARERLRLLDLSEAQIDRIAETGKLERTVTLYSPASGYVTEKKVLPGNKIMMNDPLMMITDLSRVWGQIDVYESDLANVRVGMKAEVTLPYWPGRIFRGRIAFLDPFLKPDTRTLQARIEIPNPDLILKPNMYGQAVMKYGIGDKLAVPEEAVMRTGVGNYVFIQGKGDRIVPYTVKLGVRSDDGYYEVLSGLKKGERVVTSAQFLVDSESSLKAAFQSAISGEGH